MSHPREFFDEMANVCRHADDKAIAAIANVLAIVRDLKGRVFVLGVGGSAANASHAVNDLRKLCGIEAYCPSDNAAELTARTNDEGWHSVFYEWLRVSNLGENDAILVLSVGGGDLARNVSVPLVNAIDLALAQNTWVLGIVGRDSGYTAKRADVAVVIPDVPGLWLTPLTETFQSAVLHCLVCHPALQNKDTKW